MTGETGQHEPVTTRAVQVAAVLVCLFGALCLVGWWLDLPYLASLPPSSIAMNPFTAIAFLFAGLSLWYLRSETATARGHALGKACAIAVSALGGLKLIGVISGIDLGLDQSLFREKLLAVTPPNRMAPNTALAFLLIGLALVLLDARARRGLRPAQVLCSAAVLVAFLTILGYLYQFTPFTRVATYIPMALNTALAFTVICLGIMCARPRAGVMAILTSESPGGYLLRRLLPTFLIVSVLLGWLVLSVLTRPGGLEGMASVALGVALMVALINVVAMSLFGWVANSLDVADGKRRSAELMLKRREGQLSEAEKVAQVGSWEWDIASNRVTWTDEHFRLYGFAPQSFDPTFETFLNSVHPDDRDRVGRCIRSTLGGEAPFSVDYRTIGRDGTTRVMHGQGEVTCDEAGQPIRMFGITQDVTERRRLENELRTQFEKLRELDGLKNNFVNSVTHELRTPLTSIMGYAEFLNEGIGGTLSQKQLGFVNEIAKGTRRLESLVDDLLDYARLDAGTLALNLEAVSFVTLTEAVLDSMRPQARQAGIELHAVLPSEPLLVSADSRRVEQVLINLLNNAIKFTPSNGRIMVRAVGGEGHLQCEIQDTGEGIAPEDVPKLFERFSQLEPGIRRGKGTGLGLSISKALIEAHGGNIGVRSVVEQGSTFWFTLPLGAGTALPVRETSR